MKEKKFGQDRLSQPKLNLKRLLALLLTTSVWKVKQENTFFFLINKFIRTKRTRGKMATAESCQQSFGHRKQVDEE